MQARNRTWIACVRMSPYALWRLRAQHPGVPVAVLDERSRVVHASGEAQLLGVQAGMPLHAALSRCPDLQAEVVRAPVLAAEWAQLLEGLYASHSPRVYGPTPGTVWLTLTLEGARELATALHAPVGLAGSQEVALLAALRARPGEVRDLLPEAEKAYLPLTPLSHLTALGLSPRTVERLQFLGLRGLADLAKWSKAQRAQFLGAEARLVADLLADKVTSTVPAYQPKELVERRLAFDAPLEEPGQAEAAVADLLAEWPSEFRGRVCSYLTVRAETVGGELSTTRRLKWPLDLKGLRRLALLALDETGALGLGVDALTVQFSGFAQPSRQVGLWPGAHESDAVQGVLERFPAAMVKIGWRDTHAYVADAHYVWLDWLTGEERPHRNAPRPVEQPARRPLVVW